MVQSFLTDRFGLFAATPRPSRLLAGFGRGIFESPRGGGLRAFIGSGAARPVRVRPGPRRSQSGPGASPGDLEVAGRRLKPDDISCRLAECWGRAMSFVGGVSQSLHDHDSCETQGWETSHDPVMSDNFD